jgi:hypothetical protein
MLFALARPKAHNQVPWSAKNGSGSTRFTSPRFWLMPGRGVQQHRREKRSVVLIDGEGTRKLERYRRPAAEQK